MGELMDQIMSGGPATRTLQVGPGAAIEVSQGKLGPDHTLPVASYVYWPRGYVEGVDAGLLAEAIASLPEGTVKGIRFFNPTGCDFEGLSTLVARMIAYTCEQLRAPHPVPAWPSSQATVDALRRDPFASDHAAIRWTCEYHHVLSSCSGFYPGHSIHEWLAAHASVRDAWVSVVPFL